MNDKVFWFVGRKCRRIEGEIKAFVPTLFGDAKAVILITKSESESWDYGYGKGHYIVVPVTELHKQFP